MSDQAVIKKEPATVEYVPYGAQDKIKMNVSIVQNLIAVKTKSGKTCSDKDALKFLAMCQAKRLNPFEGDAFLIGYDGREGPTFALITAHQTYLKRAELHPEIDGMKSGVIVKEQDGLKDLEGDFYADGQEVVGGWATVFFKNRKQPMHKRLRLARFQKPFGIWQEDPAGMVCKCAEADALRSAFPTMLGGLYMREEIDVVPQMAKPEFGPSKPLFENGKALPEGEAPQPDAPSESEIPPLAKSPLRNELIQPENGGFNPVKAVRGLCKAAKVKESDLLGFLFEIGAASANYDSLEQLHLTQNEVLQMVSDQFGDISKRILEAKEAK